MAIGTAALVALAAASGNFQMPVVAADGTRAGLSADRSTAVLAERPARGVSRFALIDAAHMRLRRVITLRGDFGFDAISPDAKTIYFVNYHSRDHTKYAIQSMDTTDRRARLATVVEKGEPGERMSGIALTRVSSPDGWIYTLYDGAGGHAPFIHALSSNDRFTVCIDLDALAGRSDLAVLRMKMVDNGVRVLNGKGTPLLRVDTGTFEVSQIATSQRTIQKPTRAEATPKNNDTPLALIALGVVATIGATGLALTARRSQAKQRQQRGLSPTSK